jgi:uridine phosphorylase
MHPSVEKPTKEGKQYHIQCKHGDLAEYLLIPGAPERAEKIASFWDEAKEITYSREFRSFTGKYKGVSLSALSSGIGSASIAIAVNEAVNIGVETFIRVGSTGAIQGDIGCGDLVISSAAVRLDGTSRHYVPLEYPAFSDYEVLLALIEAAEGLGAKYHVGVTATTADFYAGQARPSFEAFYPLKLDGLTPLLQKAGVLNFEMECAPLFVLCSLFGLRAGTICAVYANRVTDTFKPGKGEETCIKVANEAVRILSRWDAEKQKKGKRWLYPSLLWAGASL